MLYTLTEALTAAVFNIQTPGLAAQTHNEINELACILGKTANTTVPALTYLNDELSQVQKGILQNHTAIDYLLLKNQIGYEQLPGICCFNLTDNSKGD